MKPAILISSVGRISAVIGNEALTIETDHPNYSKIVDAIRGGAYDTILGLANVAKAVSDYVSTSGRVNVRNGQVFYGYEALHNTISERILNFINEGIPFQPMLNFIENLMQNPSKRAVDELYGFLEVGQLPITEDGHFLAYKKVRDNYTDIHSGKFDNSVGKICQMVRNKVDEDKDRTCSTGLHFCSKDYLPHFGGAIGGGYRVVIVKINPADVVSIPGDYHNTKGRCCRYEVVGELENLDFLLDHSSVYRGFEAVEYGADDDFEDGFEGDFEDDFCYSGEDEDADDAWGEGYDEGFEDTSRGGTAWTREDLSDAGYSSDFIDGYMCGVADAGYQKPTVETHGVKPSGQKFYQVRGKDGKFVKQS